MNFFFNSKIFKVFLWIFVVLVVISDIYSITIILKGNSGLSIGLIIFAIAGAGLKTSILITLIFHKGPIKALIYIWGGLFSISGITGLLSYVTSPAVEQTALYIDKSIYLLLGIGLILLTRKHITYTNETEN